jgi:hypothetical protein
VLGADRLVATIHSVLGYRMNMPRWARMVIGMPIATICFSVYWIVDAHELLAGLVAVICAQLALTVAD